MELTMVSLWYRGRYYTRFVLVKPCQDGKVRVDVREIFRDFFETIRENDDCVGYFV